MNSVERLFDSIKRGAEGLTRLVCTLPNATEEEKEQFRANLIKHLLTKHGLKIGFDTTAYKQVFINLDHALSTLTYTEYVDLAIQVKPELKKNLVSKKV